MQGLGDHIQGHSGKVHGEDSLDHLGFLGDDLGLAVLTLAIAEQFLVLEHGSAFLELFSERPCYILTNALGLGLCETCVYDEVQFAVVLEGVDLLFLEVYADAFCFEDTHIFQTLDCVSCES